MEIKFPQNQMNDLIPDRLNEIKKLQSHFQLNNVHYKPKSEKSNFSNIAFSVTFLINIHTGVLSIEEESELFTKIIDLSQGEKLIKKDFLEKHRLSH